MATPQSDRPSASPSLSFRGLLRGELAGFLVDVEMESDSTADALTELVMTLARCREEGAALFPSVFIADDRAALMALVVGSDFVRLGEGDISVATMQQAIKLCAPLGRGGWSVYIGREAGGLAYGVFRTDNFVLQETAMERLRASDAGHLHAFGVIRLGEEVVELRGSGGVVRYIYLSGAHAAGMAPSLLTRQLVAMTVKDAPERAQAALRIFYRRILIQAARSTHGNLIAVVDARAVEPKLCTDGALLATPIDVADAIDAYERAPSETTRESVQALANLLWGMLSSDGVTVVRSDGAMLGFNAFIAHDAARAQAQGEARRVVGGARRRTFETLCASIGGELAAAYFQSQDGAAELRTHESMLEST